MNILFFIFVFASMIQIGFWLIIAGRFNRYPESGISAWEGEASISVVVVLKNGAKHLPALIENLLNQDYLHYELVFVDDHSTDNSHEIISDYQSTDNRIKYYAVQIDKPGKKQALREIIPRIKSTLVLFTDVDCLPVSNRWISSIVSGFVNEKSIVVGYSPMIPEKGPVNLFSRFETFMTAVQYFSWTLWGLPYMAVGRNMAYRTSLFHRAIYKDKLVSGDDDLFIQAKGTKENVRIITAPESFVYTYSKPRFKSFLDQKRRHISSSKYYKTIHKIILGSFAGSQMLYVFLAVYLLICSDFLWPVSLLILIRQAVYYFSVRKSMEKLGEHGLVCRVFRLDLSLALYYLVIALLMTGKSKKDWN